MELLTWNDYYQGYDDLEKYMERKHGVAGKHKITTFRKRIPQEISECHGLRTVDTVDSMVFGQFIIMERALTSGLKPQKALFELSKALIRPSIDTVFDNTDPIKEANNTKAILDLPAKDVLSYLSDFSEKRNKFVKKDFAGVFYKEPEEGEEEEEENEEDIVDTLEERFNRDWYWYTILNTLSQDDITKHETILMMKMSEIAPHLAYMRMRGLLEYKRRKMEEMARKSKMRN